MNETYNSELYHHGVLGMKWGVRRYQNKDGSLTNAGRKRINKYDEYGNNIKGSKLFAPHKAMIKGMLKATQSNSNRTKTRDKIDDANIRYNTKNMNDKDKNLYSLNYYNAKKHVSKIAAQNASGTLAKLKNPNKSRGEQKVIDLLGSDFYKKIANMNMSAALENRQHYSKKVDDLLSDIGSTKLSTIKSMHSFTDGTATYSWYGDEYIYR